MDGPLEDDLLQTDPAYVGLLERAAAYAVDLKFNAAVLSKQFDSNWMTCTGLLPIPAYLTDRVRAEGNALAEAQYQEMPGLFQLYNTPEEAYIRANYLRTKVFANARTALREMFEEHIAEWSMECAEFAALLHAYALAMTFDEYDSRSLVVYRLHHFCTVRPRILMWFNRSNAGDALKFQGSSPAVQAPEDGQPRNMPGAPQEQVAALKESILKATPETALDLCPAGTLAIWTNPKARLGSSFRNENAIKLGHDRYAAHGFAKEVNVFSARQISDFLERDYADNPSGGDAAAGPTFLSCIIVFELPLAKR